MDKPDQSPAPSEEEFPPLQDDPTMPTPEEPAAPIGAADLLEPVEPEVPALPKEDPWAEAAAPVPMIPPPSARVRMLAVGLLSALAVATIIFLCICIHNRDLKSQLDHALQADVDKAPDFLIVSAVYGSGTHFSDVTDRVTELLRRPNAEFNARPDALHKDPVPGWNKELVIIYKTGGQRHIFMTGEGGRVNVANLLDEAKR